MPAFLLTALAWLVASSPAGAEVATPSGGFFAFGGEGEVVRTTQIPVALRGRVDVDFRGDAAAGCAERGVCDLSGSVSWEPGRKGILALADVVSHGHREVVSFLFLRSEDSGEGSSATTRARVLRTAPDGTVMVCSDVRPAPFATFFEEPSLTTLGFTLTDPDGQGASHVTRCGGPLDADLAGVLPRRSLPMAAARRGRRSVDLSGERTFSNHGFAGTLRSSVVLRLGAPTLQEEQSDEDSEYGPSLVRRKQKELVVTYDVETVDGAVTLSFEGLRERALCAPLAACDLGGRTVVNPRGSRGTARLTVDGAAARHSWRELRAAAGLAPGGRAPGLSVLGTVEWRSRTGSATETVRRADGTSCHDAIPVREGAVGLKVAGSRVYTTYSAGYEGAVLRTRCPGPMGTDVTPSAELASGSQPLRDLGRHRVRLALTRGRGFTAAGYHGRTFGDMAIVLRRTGVRLRTAERTVPR